LKSFSHLLLFAVALAMIGCRKQRPVVAPAVPQRIVSITVTGDVLLDALHIPPGRIQAVSALADDSGIHEAAGCFPGKPRLGANLEKILALRPDLVIVGSFHDPAFLQGLQEAGVPMLHLEDPSSIARVRDFLHVASARLGAAATGDSLVHWMDSTLSAVEARGRNCPSDTPSVLYWSDGYTAGTQCTLDELMRIAGVRNLGARIGRVRASRIATEDLAGLSPDWILLSDWHHQGEIPFPEQAKRLTAWKSGKIVHLPGKVLLSTSHRLALAADSLQKAFHRGCEK
jgi:iron complex transport system substrate-binding protein